MTRKNAATESSPKDPAAPSSRVDPRLLPFLLVVLVFLAGNPLSRWAPEPYPAIMMPGFPGSGVANPEGFPVRTVEIEVRTREGQVVAMSLEELLWPFPSSHWETILQGFRAGDAPSRETMTSAVPDLHGFHVGPQIRRAFYESDMRYHTHEAQAWLAERARASTGEEPAALRFIWWREVFPRGGSAPAERTEFGTFTVEFPE